MCRLDNSRALAVCHVKRRHDNDLRGIACSSGHASFTATDEAVQTDNTSVRLTSAEQPEGERSMAAVVIIDNPFATLWYHPEKRIVHHRIHQFISGKAFRDLLLTGTDVLTKNQATKW